MSLLIGLCVFKTHIQDSDVTLSWCLFTAYPLSNDRKKLNKIEKKEIK